MDQDYIQLIRLNNGSKQAFVALYTKYVGRIYNYVRSMLLDEDITQLCFMRVWENKTKIKPDSNFAAYIYVIARNEVYKETRRLVTSANYINLVAKYNANSAETTAFDVNYSLLEKEIAKVIEKLPESRKRIYVMNTEQCMSIDEIARQLNISPKTVETQIGRVVAALRKHLARFV